jgi:hypothetical protein
LDFTLYQESGYQLESEFAIEEIPPPQVVAPPNLYFNPQTSPGDSDNTDDPDYEHLDPIQPCLIGSDESVSVSLPACSLQSTSFSNQSLPRESSNALNLSDDSNSSSNVPYMTQH